MKRTNNPVLLHTFFFAIYPSLSLYAHNVNEVSFFRVLQPITITLIFTVLALLLTRLLLRSYYKAGILVSIFILLFFSFGAIWYVIEGLQINIIKRCVYLLSVEVLFFIGCIYYLKKTKQVFHGVTRILNVVAITIIAIPILKVMPYYISKKYPLLEHKKDEPAVESPIVTNGSFVLPDIYYLILDRYAGSKTLSEVYNFNNSEFISNLSNRGFYIASESKSNYLFTASSLASSLNFEFINFLTKSMGEDSRALQPLHELIQNNRVVRFLKGQGYKYIHAGSYYGPTRTNASANITISYLLPTRFIYLLYTQTALYPFLSMLDITQLKDFNRQHWEATQKIFDALSKIPFIKGNKFVFAHILLPHPPFIFDRYGNFTEDDFIPPTQVADLEDKERELHRKYIEQLIFTNTKVIELIDRLLSRSITPPIIIIQADEGPWPVRYYLYKDEFNWQTQATDTELKAKTGILNAFYLPGTNYTVILYSSITPVNTFRVIFNAYFKQYFELLPDETYANEDLKHPYKLFSVTNRVK
jgi:hypothetical protein